MLSDQLFAGLQRTYSKYRSSLVIVSLSPVATPIVNVTCACNVSPILQEPCAVLCVFGCLAQMHWQQSVTVSLLLTHWQLSVTVSLLLIEMCSLQLRRGMMTY